MVSSLFKIVKYLCITLTSTLTLLFSECQAILTENFFNEDIIGYYLSAIDIETGQSNILLFDYTLDLDNENYNKLHVYFDIYMNIPSMTGSEYSTSLKPLTNGKFSLNPPINGLFPNQISFRNTDLNLDTQYLPGGVQFNINQSDYNIEITDTEITDLTEMIMGMARIPNGMYSFSFKVCEVDNNGQEGICSESLVKNIEIFVPSYLELIMPGSSEISDTLSNIVYSSYPVFQWNSDYCSNCNYSIRISEFNSENHSSLFEGIEDVSILPATGSGYYNISNSSNIFQYPESGVESLVQGKKYVWQILRSFETTNGVNEELSQIFIFKMQDATQMQTYSSSYDVALDNIKELIGESIFNQLFSEDGELYNYNNVSSTITVNGEEFSNNYIIELIEMLNNNQINIIDVNAE
mgnify:CR=1 FL=1